LEFESKIKLTYIPPVSEWCIQSCACAFFAILRHCYKLL